MGWVRLDDDFPHHPKALAAGAEGVALYVAGLCYCSKQETDGRIPRAAIPLLVADLRKPLEVAERLITVGLWEDEPGCYIVRNYLEYQRSKEEIEEIREQKREAGRRGGLASGRSRRGSKPEAECFDSGSRSVEAKSNPHTHTHTQVDLPTGKGLLKCSNCSGFLDDDGYCVECSVVWR